MTELSRTPVASHGDWFEQYLPAPEAIARIKILQRNKAGGKARAVFIVVEQKGRTDDERYFPISGSVKVPVQVACDYVHDSYRNFTERGALVRLSWCGTCLFVG